MLRSLAGIRGVSEAEKALPAFRNRSALAKASTENEVATAVRGGMGARGAFETFGVL
jgi:hypothetical protein